MNSQDLEAHIGEIKEIRHRWIRIITCIIGTDVTWRNIVIFCHVSFFVDRIEASAALDYFCLIANPLTSLKDVNVNI